MRKKICIATGSRAEYGLLEPLIRVLSEDDFFDVRIAVTGTHLNSEFGMTYKQIEDDGYRIDTKIEILPLYDTVNATSIAMGKAIEKFSEYFREVKPDILILLGDRYEAFAIAAAAVVTLTPIAHIHGGEISEGAYDDCFRHCITKMSQIHFPSCEIYKNRIIQMGEQPDKVFNVGALGIENIMRIPLLSYEEIVNELGIKLNMPYAVVTYHPVTLKQEDPCSGLIELLEAIDNCKDMQFVITKSNADDGGAAINQMLEKYSSDRIGRVKLFDNLGQLKYLSAVKYSEFVLGNSSSGVIEVPALKRPTVNIGIREKGRLQVESIINCEPDTGEIMKAIELARSIDMQKVCSLIKSPFDGGDTSMRIKTILKQYLMNDSKTLQKSFYDVTLDKNS